MKPIYFFLLLAFIGLSNCTNNTKNNQEDPSDENTTVEEPPATLLEAVEANLSCRQLSTEEDPFPLFEVSLQVGENTMVLDTINSCGVFAKTDYEQYEIPPNALSACGGWYAGAGDYFYVVRNQDELSVIRGWQGEEQEEPGFHYTEVQKIALK